MRQQCFMHDCIEIFKDTEQPQEKEKSRFQFLGGSFSNKDNVRAPIQSRRESQPQHLKNDFSSLTNPFIFTSVAPMLLK